jgi:hypothetical protein
MQNQMSFGRRKTTVGILVTSDRLVLRPNDSTADIGHGIESNSCVYIGDLRPTELCILKQFITMLRIQSPPYSCDFINYFDKAVWRHYVAAHVCYFQDRNVEGEVDVLAM